MVGVYVDSTGENSRQNSILHQLGYKFEKIEVGDISSLGLGIISVALNGNIFQLTALPQFADYSSFNFFPKDIVRILAYHFIQRFPHLACINYIFPEVASAGFDITGSSRYNMSFLKDLDGHQVYLGFYHLATAESNVLSFKSILYDGTELGAVVVDLAICSFSSTYIGSRESPVSRYIMRQRLQMNLQSIMF
jgi:hypothetical protein